MSRRIVLMIAVTVMLGLGMAGNCRAQSLTTTQKGLIGGTLLGAGTGAIVGAVVHHPIAGTAIGGGLGLVAGGVVGHALQNNQNQETQEQAELAAQQAQIQRQRQEIKHLQQMQDTE
ncbi:MAG TPA: glycine zipper domain-containing protein [Candidatus Binataceae bacterium]|nr:glycine zipper domain-containing protein [Candidatus Binataceae bacterium]